ncbi:hypothetical protein BD414DRAFT_526416 [Trametes punicea]|nr:hypothetical protein BD414DRAFT_526416 [Trametes punicea]
MLSFFSTFRAVARRQPCRFPAARTVSTSPAQPQTVEASSMEEMAEFVYESAEGQELRNNDGDGLVDIEHRPPLDTGASRAFPVLTGFQANQPRDFTRDAYKKKVAYSKRPLLGPDAATSRYLDIFHQMNIDPLNECRNSMLMSSFVTSMGKIKGRNETNLTWKNQRKLGKAIRRAKMMGIIPVLSRRHLLFNRR